MTKYKENEKNAKSELSRVPLGDILKLGFSSKKITKIIENNMK